jgi:hypothetical protein
MNETQKDYMNKKSQQIYNDLKNTFSLPIFEDEVDNEELGTNKNYFLIVYGDMQPANSEGSLSQEFYVVYVSEDNPNVETTTIDIISTMVKISNVTFGRTIKERVQKNDTDDYIDRVTLIFRRKLKYER